MVELREPAGADAARLLYADDARRLSDLARQLVPTSREHQPGDYLREALWVAKAAQQLVLMAAVVERARGATWEVLGEVENVSRQHAQRKWGSEVSGVVDALASGVGAGPLLSRKAATGADLARRLDQWYERHAEPGDDPGPEYADGAVSGYLIDPGPAPDLSDYDTLDDDAYEWLLSDHPWARAERIRRAEASYGHELRTAAAARDWVDKVEGADHGTTSPEFAENLGKLAALIGPMADKAQLRNQLAAAEPDDLRVIALRRRFETHQNVTGADDYHYPAHLLGPGAAAYPPPGRTVRD
jgi:hypothetical protein